MGKAIHTNITQKKTGVDILISDEVDFRAKKITRDRKAHYIMIKGSIHLKDIAILIIHASNKSYKICKAKTDRSGRKIDKFTIIVGDFNIFFSKIDRKTRQKSGCRQQCHEPTESDQHS